MKKKIIVALGLAAVVGVAIVLYIMFAPHRDVQSSPVDFEVTASSLVKESLENPQATNNKYLAEDGDSKIIAITGTVASIELDFENNQVVLLKEQGENAKALTVGEEITIKGVYRVAASYDEDFEEYEDVIVEESDILKV